MTLTVPQANAMLDELFAPWVRDLRLTVESVELGAATLRMPFDPRLARVGGTVCGQALMALADTAMVFVISSALGGFKPMTTVNQSTNFMRAIAGKDVIAEGRILRLGRTMAFGEVFLRAEGDDGPSAHVASAYALVGASPTAPAAPPSPH